MFLDLGPGIRVWGVVTTLKNFITHLSTTCIRFALLRLSAPVPSLRKMKL